MESSKMFGGGEECHSSESGWTMYLGSSINGDVHIQDSYYDEDDVDALCRKNYYLQGGDQDSDDSMASDASSGPNTHFNLKNDDVDDDDEHQDEDSKYSKIKNGTKTRTAKTDEKEQVARTKTRKSHSYTAPKQTAYKVRKSTWMGKN